MRVPKRPYPLLRIAVCHHVGGVQIGADPVAADLVDELAHFARAEQKLVPDVFNADGALPLLRDGRELLEAAAERVPSVVVGSFLGEGAGVEQRRAGAESLRDFA